MTSVIDQFNTKIKEYPLPVSVKAIARPDNHALSGLVGGRLGVRLFLVVFLCIIAIETAVLLPSYASYRRDLQDHLEHVGRTIMAMTLKPRGLASERDILLYARLAVDDSELFGVALYRLDGSLIGHFGEKPELSPDEAGERPVMARMTGDGKRLEVVWRASELGLPVTVVGRLDAEWIEPELNAFVWRIAGLVMLITVFVGGAVMVIFNRAVLRRILLLRQGMAAASEDPEAAAARNFPARSRDELDDLAREFNGMIARIAQSIAERKQAEQALISAKEQAEWANRSKSEFLAHMSHELRTPLNAIIGFSAMIQEQTFGPVGNAKYVEYVRDINDAGHHLLELINDVLDLSKIEVGKLDLHDEALDISAIILSSVRLVAERARAMGLHLDPALPDDIPPLRADSRMLKQILLNLLSNAIKFTPAGGRICVRLRFDAGEGHVIEVADTGIGIAPQDINTALERFGQVDSALNRKYDGAGLGLPLSKSLVELHGGSLSLDSDVGVGTTVTIRFPLERSHPFPTSSVAAANQPASREIARG